jgi:TolB-like protein/tetratricopeptide (TPR) repeat protein
MSDLSFFAELKRRNVLRAAALYVGAAWALSQGVAQLLPAFDFPNWVVRWFVIAELIGFPFAMLFSWFYEWTPRGIQRESEIAPDAALTRESGRKLDRWIIAVMSIAIVLLLTNTFVSRKGAGLDAGTDAPAADKSIAVLPFDNLSDDKANAYFAVGIQDEILTRLAKISALKVISRTSTQHYASSPDNLPAIARQLGVANILEGSVQKAGNTVHINVQLIHAATDAHLWAESYDRTLDNVFGVEGEVAQTIAEMLKARLSGVEVAQVTALPTTNPAAYDAYLHGVAADRNVFGSVSLLKAASGFHAQATQLDPKFALAWALGSIDDGLIYFQAFDRSPARLEAARHGADMAMQLAPESPEAWLAKGSFLYHTLDFDGARAAFAQADKRLPNNPQILASQGYLERRSGHFDQGIALLTRSLERDPQNVANITSLADTLNATGRPQEALGWMDRALTFSPGDTAIIAQKGQILMAAGDLDSAGRLLDPLPMNADDVFSTQTQVAYLFARRNYSAVIRLLQAAIHAPGFVLNAWNSNDYWCLGWAQRLSGDEKAARATFAEGRRRIDALDASTSDNGYLASQLALIDAGLGDADGAEREGRLAVQRAGNDRYNAASLEGTLAEAEALSGRTEQALSTLARLADDPVPVPYGDLKLSPFWDGLRSDPRFVKLLADSEARMKARAAHPQ